MSESPNPESTPNPQSEATSDVELTQKTESGETTSTTAMKEKLRQSQKTTGTFSEALGRRNFIWAIIWILLLAVGTLGEQIKTRWEYARGEGKNKRTGDIPERDRQEIVTASGLHFIDIKLGAGERPHEGDLCLVNYTLTLADGAKIVSSRDGGQKALAFIFGQKNLPRDLIPPGLVEGISTMRQGGKRKLILPPELGFGDKPRLFPNEAIAAGSTLVYEVELTKLSIAPS